MTTRALSLMVLAACSGSGDSYTQPPPVVVDDHIMLGEDQPLRLSDLADNDTGVTTELVVDMPMHGTIVENQYLPEPGYFGPDQFTYEGRSSDYYGTPSRATVYVDIASDGIPYEHSRLLGMTDAQDLAAADLDGDGKIDLVTVDTSRNEMTVFRNTTSGEGAYSLEAHIFEGGSAPVRLAIGDVDGDGKRDIVTAAKDGVTIFRNLTAVGGALAFAGPVVLATVDPTFGVALADLDGDGKLDLAAITNHTYYATGHMAVWLNTSTPGTVTTGVQTVFDTPDVPRQIVAVDADGNGAPDLAVLGTGQLSLFLDATGAGAAVAAFQARIDRGTAPDPQQMFLADLDGDGASEIGVLHEYGDLWIYANRGSASPSFEAARSIALPTNTTFVETAQLDSDNKIDLVGATTGVTPFEFLANQSITQSFMFDETVAKIADVETHKAAGFAIPTGLRFVDLDGVAPLEIVVASQTSSSSYDGKAGLRVLYGN